MPDQPESYLHNPEEIVRRFNDALNARDLAAMCQLLTPGTVFENTYPPPGGTRFTGLNAVRAFWESFFESANQINFEVEEIFGWGDRCVVRWLYRWTNHAGQSGHIRGVDLFRLENGLIAEKLSYVKG